MKAPSAKPTSDSAPTMNPCAQPNSASSSTTPDDDPVEPGHAPSVPRGRVPRPPLTLRMPHDARTSRPRRRRPPPGAPPPRARRARARLAALVGVARSRSRRLVVGARHEPAERAGAALRAGVGARRLRRDVRAARRRRAQARVGRAALRARLPRRGRHARRSSRPRRPARRERRRRRTRRPCRCALDTRIFGTRRAATLALPSVDGADGDAGVDWRAAAACSPACAAARRSRARPRCRRAPRSWPATARRSPRARRRGSRDLGPLAAEVAGPRRPGAARARRRARRARRARGRAGRPHRPRARSSTTQLRRHARAATLLRRQPRARAARRRAPGAAVRTTIDPDIQRAAVDGARRPLRRHRRRCARATGEVLALAGHRLLGARSRPARRSRSSRSPGAARARRGQALDDASRSQTTATLEGVELAERQRRGLRRHAASTRSPSRATRCSPRSARSSARERLVATAERFGFNQDPRLAGAARSHDPGGGRDRRRPRASARRAIGQGKVLATPLQMALGRRDDRRARPRGRADAAQGRRQRPRRARRRAARRPHDRAAACARWCASGTGVGAAIPGVTVAGKTGTAELRTTVNAGPASRPTRRRAAAGRRQRHRRLVRRLRALPAPADRGRVLLVGQGAGGDTAAPAARDRASRRRWRCARRRGRRAGRRPRPCSMLELERAVLQRVGLELEEQQRALDRGPGRRSSRAAGRSLSARACCGAVGERVALRSSGTGLNVLPCVSAISKSSVAGGRLSPSVLDAHEDAEPDLVACRLDGPGGQAAQVGVVLDVVRVQEARDLDLVLEAVRRRGRCPPVARDVRVSSLLPQPATASMRPRQHGEQSEDAEGGASAGSHRRRRQRSDTADRGARAAVVVLLEDRLQPPQRLARRCA